MLAPNNFLSPATGEPILTPSQDMVLGSYYLTANNPTEQTPTDQYFLVSTMLSLRINNLFSSYTPLFGFGSNDSDFDLMDLTNKSELC